MQVVKLILKYNVKNKGLLVKNVVVKNIIGWKQNPNGNVPHAALEPHFEAEQLWRIPNFLFTLGTHVWLL
jgi:hypothetical protein